MRTGRPTMRMILPIPERDTLARWARRRTPVQALAQRTRIIPGEKLWTLVSTL